MEAVQVSWSAHFSKVIFVGQFYPGKSFKILHVWCQDHEEKNFTWKWQICPPLNQDLHWSLSIESSRKNLLQEKKL